MRTEPANSARTARRANGDGVAPAVHTHSEGDRGASPQGGSLRSGLVSTRPEPPRSPSSRLRTATGETPGTATLETATGNSAEPHSATAQGTAKGEERGRRPRTAWELRELIRPLPVRRTRAAKRPQPHYFDAALVEWVYESRFAIVSQLQRRFPERLPSVRTAQRHAQRLVQLGLLAPAPVRSTGPNFPLVLYTTGRGIRLVRDTYARLGKPWDGPRTEDGKAQGLALDSILHEVLITEFDLGLQRTVEARHDLVLLKRERRYFRRDRQLTYERQGRRERVIPDAGYLAAVQTNNVRELLPVMFLELENGTHSVAKIRQKLKRYQRWAEQSAGEYLRQLYAPYGESQKRSFRVLFVAHDKHGNVSDERRLLDLLVQTLQLPRALRNAIWLTTAEALATSRNDPQSNDPQIWYRARDLSQVAADLRRVEGDTVEAQLRGQRRLIAARLPELHRHGLFPRPEPATPIRSVAAAAGDTVLS